MTAMLPRSSRERPCRQRALTRWDRMLAASIESHFHFPEVVLAALVRQTFAAADRTHIPFPQPPRKGV